MYKTKFESIKENLDLEYGDNLRMFNTNILIYIIKTNLSKILFSKTTHSKKGFVITNTKGDKLKCHDGSFMLETKDSSNATIIQKMEEDDIIKFLIYSNVINHIKL